MSPAPAISIVMPVHNAAPYLERSVSSVLAQTFCDFELVILENGSTDESGRILRAFAERDPRIRLFHAPGALASAGSSNLVISHARADVIVRMDADDVSHPARVERQLEVLERHPEATLVGTLYEGIDPAGRRVRPRDRSSLTRPGAGFPCPHGSIAFRRKAFDEVGGYREECQGWEDLDLVERLAEVGRILVLPCALYAYRFHPQSLTARMPIERSMGRGDVLDTVYMHSAARLWSGEPPALLRELAARGLIGRLRGRLRLLLWGAWARLSPGSLRRVLRLWISARDRAADRGLPRGEPVEWRFGHV
jgi:glycosyltransferase involved in cell wall biosynthesis